MIPILAYLLILCGFLDSSFSLALSVQTPSTRQTMLEKSKALNPDFQYMTSGWSNRAGTVVTPISLSPDGGVYSADRQFIWNNIDVGGRATIIELPSSTGDDKPDLWIHSPVNLDKPLRDALAKLGNIKYVVSPNYEHVKYASQWYKNCPGVAMWACPGLPERVPEVSWNEIPYGIRPMGWKGSTEGAVFSMDSVKSSPWDVSIVQPLHLNCEVNPFTQRPFFNEVVFYHSPTKTLVTTDVFWNYPENGVPNSKFGRDDSWELAPKVDSVPFGTLLWKKGMDKIYLPFYNNLMVNDRSTYRQIADHIVNTWDVETVVPAHGDIMRGKSFITSVLKKHFQLD